MTNPSETAAAITVTITKVAKPVTSGRFGNLRWRVTVFDAVALRNAWVTASASDVFTYQFWVDGVSLHPHLRVGQQVRIARNQRGFFALVKEDAAAFRTLSSSAT